MMMTKAKKRIGWIDIARGIAIICVIIGHSMGKYYPNYLVKLIYAFHIPIFFILSGYLYRPKKVNNFFHSSWFNLLIPYITTVILELILYSLFLIHKNSFIAPSRVNSVHEFLISAIYGIGAPTKLPLINFPINAIGAIWFLMAFFIGTQIFNIVMSLKFNNNDLLYKVLIILGITFLGIYLQNYIYLPFSINAAFVSQFFFLAGYIIKKYSLLTIKNRLVYVVLLLIWLMEATIGVFGMDNLDFPKLYLALIGGVASAYLVIKISILLDQWFTEKHHIVIKKLIQFWGAESLSIFCFHLIDLDFIQIWPRIITHCSEIMPYGIAITCGIIYRILFVTVITYLVPYIPLIRSCYMHRKFKFSSK